MARSNDVIRRFRDNEGNSTDVFMCSAGHEFTRPTMRGVKPFECEAHTSNAPRERKPSDSDDCGGCANSEHCGACPCCPKPEAPKQHKQYGTLIALLLSNTPEVPIQPYLFGEAGTGKTFTSGIAARELGLDFRTESCSIGGTEVDFFGFIDANGAYHRTAFRDVWENGGLFLCDELDKASPYVLSKLNAAFASRAGQSVEFPDGPVARHADCYIVGAGNTDMRGGTERFHTSQPVDAATMTRFAFLEWGFDEEFEFTLVDKRHHTWVRRIHAYRKAVVETANQGANINVSPRAILMGAALRDSGLQPDVIEEVTVWQGVNDDTKRTIKSAARV